MSYFAVQQPWSRANPGFGGPEVYQFSFFRGGAGSSRTRLYILKNMRLSPSPSEESWSLSIFSDLVSASRSLANDKVSQWCLRHVPVGNEGEGRNRMALSWESQTRCSRESISAMFITVPTTASKWFFSSSLLLKIPFIFWLKSFYKKFYFKCKQTTWDLKYKSFLVWRTLC